MHTVIETREYLASADYEGVTEDERAAIAVYIAQSPTSGDVMKDTGGARKVRIAAEGKGKSGGFRVITFFGGHDIPVFLLDIYSKGTKENLSQAQRNAMRKFLTVLPATWRAAAAARARRQRE